MNADNSRDVIIGKYAARNFLVPQIGQFSSAGPFFYGPWYYWYLELVSFIPFGLLTPWIFNVLLDVFFVLLIYKLGKEAGGRKVGLVASLLAAISPAEIGNSLTTWNVYSVPILVLTSLLLLIKFIKSKKAIHIFLLSFVIFLSWTIHFQSILIMPTLLIALVHIKPSFKLLKCIGLIILGSLLALLPLIVFDARFGWYDFRSILIYLLIDQYKIYVPNRWLTYIFDYWPYAWSMIIGGNKYVSFILIFLAAIYSFLRFANFRKHLIFCNLILLFLIEIFLFRYYRGGRADYLSSFANPMIFVITASVCIWTFQFSRILGSILFSIIVVCTFVLFSGALKDKKNDYVLASGIVREVTESYPDGKFDLYSCSQDVNSISYPVALIMYDKGLNDDSGEKVGTCMGGWVSLRLRNLDDGNIHWYRKNAKDIYIDTEEWWKKDKPKVGNDFWRFLINQMLAK